MEPGIALARVFGWAQWSADGSRIALRAGVGGDAQSIVIAAIDGREVRTITTKTPARLHTSEPVWSPDGRRLAYVGADATGTHLYLVEEDGTGAGKLTYEPGNDTWPHWIPVRNSVCH
jgi:TolB protein